MAFELNLSSYKRESDYKVLPQNLIYLQKMRSIVWMMTDKADLPFTNRIIE